MLISFTIAFSAFTERTFGKHPGLLVGFVAARAHMCDRNWRIVRMDAFSRLLSAMNDQTTEQIVTPAVLSTYAAVVWMVNGVHSRPNPESGGRACRNVAIPHFEDYSATELLNAGFNEGELDTLADEHADTTFSPFNVLFMRRIHFPPETNTVRLPMNRLLPERFHTWMFGKSLADLRLQFKATGIVRRRDLHAQRFPMNKGLSRARIGPTPPNALTAFVGLADIEEDPILDVGPDVPVQQQVLDDDGAEPERTVEQKARDIWAQFPCCLLQKIGNSKKWSLPSYCRISQLHRQSVTIDVMKDTNLAKVFARVQVCHTDKARWRKAFEACFPPKGHTTPQSTQTWTHMRYYLDWKTLLASLDIRGAETVREVIWEEFKNLAWIPAATGDRPWRTDRMQEPWIQLPPLNDTGNPFAQPNIPGPQVLWSPYNAPNIVWDPFVPAVVAPSAEVVLRVNGQNPARANDAQEELSGDEAEEAEVEREISVVDDGHPGGPRGGRANRGERASEARESTIRGLSRTSNVSSNRHGQQGRPNAQRQQSVMTDFFTPPRNGSPFASPRIGTPGGPQRRQTTLSNFFASPRNGTPGRPSAALERSRAGSSRGPAISGARDRGSFGSQRSHGLLGGPSREARTPQSLGRRTQRQEEEGSESGAESQQKRARVGGHDDDEDLGVQQGAASDVDIEALKQEEEDSE